MSVFLSKLRLRSASALFFKRLCGHGSPALYVLGFKSAFFAFSECIIFSVNSALYAARNKCGVVLVRDNPFVFAE